MHRSKSSFLEWLVYSLIFFFLYDIIWILVDLPDFLQSISGLYPELLVDFALCGLFSLSSLYLNRWLFKQQRFWREWQGHRVFVQNGLVVLGFNLLIAGGCELLLSLVAPKLMMQDIWGTSFLFGLIASLVALIHLSMHFSDMIVLKGKENLALQKRYLMMQLDPHFVFNSFSSLAGMIGENPKMAEDYVVKLSHIYRYILQHIDKEYITLADGTDFIKSYIDTIRILPKRRNRLRNRPNPPSKQKRRYPFTCFRTAAFTPIRQEDAENARQNHSFGAVRSALPCVIPILAKALPTVITTSIFRGSRPSLSFRATYNLFGLSDGTTISYHSFSNFINPKSSP